MKKVLQTLLGLVCLVLISPSAFAQVELSFQTEVAQDNQYCATVIVKSNGGEETAIGTSSFYIEYNKEALKFNSYTSHSFDQSVKCVADQYAAYTNHNFDASTPGVINTTIFLKNPRSACPEVSAAPTELATICFEVTDATQNSQLKFNDKHTNIDKASLKVELMENVTLVEANEPLSSKTTR